ncbi:MAG: hypothetical protein HDR88_04785 [Bacteroides sp.]|nr:hypothetical protein [Bacteroides sp.]
MDKTVKFRRAFRMVALCMLALLLPALSSCKQESVNVTDLLSTVPSSSSVVMGINIESLLKKSGCKIEGSAIVPGNEVQALLGSDSFKNSKDSKIIEVIFNGGSGIDPVGAILFKDAYNEYLTFALADTDKFKSFIEQHSGETFTDGGNDVQVCGNVAVKGAQAWIADGTTIDPKAVANYASLGDGQSFMTKDFSDKIANMTTDFVGWGEIRKLLEDKMSMSERTTVMLINGILFDEAQSILFDVDMLKGEAKATFSVYNKEGKPAKYLLPSDKLNVETIKKVGPKANALVAVSITKELIKKLDSLLSSFGGEIEQTAKALKSVDGTTAVAFENLSDMSVLKGVVTTDGKAGLDLMQLISSIAPTSKDGKLVLFSKGVVGGELDVDKEAENLKNATFGVVLSMASSFPDNHSFDGFKTLTVAFEPKGGSVECDITLKAVDSSRNILLPIIETLAK